MREKEIELDQSRNKEQERQREKEQKDKETREREHKEREHREKEKREREKPYRDKEEHSDHKKGLHNSHYGSSSSKRTESPSERLDEFTNYYFLFLFFFLQTKIFKNGW